MPRPSDDLDFSEGDVATDADPSPLRRLVLAQFHEPGGAAVQLFTTATLRGGWDRGRAAAVVATAADLGLDLDRVELFSADAYLLQSALGERALAGDREPGGVTLVACNYHDVPPENRPAVEERLRRLRDLGEPLDLGADIAVAHGPRVVVGIYDAYREAGLFGAELCDRLGLPALFFPVFEPGDDEPGTAGLRDDELADIARRHELGFHTASHVRADEVDEGNLEREVTAVVARLTELGGPPRIAAWCGGSRWDASRLGDRTIRDLGLRYQMSNWAIEEAPCSPPQSLETMSSGSTGMPASARAEW